MRVCWWCVHPFEEPPLHAPYKYDSRRRHFDTMGYFCSWECIKAFMLNQADARAGERQMFLSLMRKHAAGKHVPIKAAPKRELLTIFGGPLTIEEFRKGNRDYEIYMPNESHRIPILYEKNAVPIRRPGEDTKSELLLKRSKPMERSKSILETSLGITRSRVNN